MPNHTERAGPLPGGSIDFNKVNSAARQGKKDIYEGAVTHKREADEPSKEEAKADAAALETQAKEAGLEVADDNTLVQPNADEAAGKTK